MVHESWGSFLSGGSDGQAAGSATTVEEASEGCTRVVRVEHGGAREVHEFSGERDCGVVHEIT